jgi:hypothetical protein
MTAIEWLTKEIELDTRFDGIFKDVIKQAREMEKYQIIDSYIIGYNDAKCHHINDAEQYYSQTYNHD